MMNETYQREYEDGMDAAERTGCLTALDMWMATVRDTNEEVRDNIKRALDELHMTTDANGPNIDRISSIRNYVMLETARLVHGPCPEAIMLRHVQDAKDDFVHLFALRMHEEQEALAMAELLAADIMTDDEAEEPTQEYDPQPEVQWLFDATTVNWRGANGRLVRNTDVINVAEMY